MMLFKIPLFLILSIVLFSRCGEKKEASHNRNASSEYCMTEKMFNKIYEYPKDNSPNYQENCDNKMNIGDLLSLFNTKEKQRLLDNMGYHFLGIPSGGVPYEKESYHILARNNPCPNRVAISYGGCDVKSPVNAGSAGRMHSFLFRDINKSPLSFTYDAVQKSYNEASEIRQKYIDDLKALGFSNITEDFIGMYGNVSDWRVDIYEGETEYTYFKENIIVSIGYRSQLGFSVSIFDREIFNKF